MCGHDTEQKLSKRWSTIIRCTRLDKSKAYAQLVEGQRSSASPGKLASILLLEAVELFDERAGMELLRGGERSFAE